MILVDTSVWIDFFRGHNSKECLALQNLLVNEADISIAEIIFTEILQGIREDKDFRRVRDFLCEIPVEKPKGLQTYLAAAEIYRNCRKKGKTVRKTVDCLIAAICIENNRELLHKDSDFDQIAGCSALKSIQL